MCWLSVCPVLVEFVIVVIVLLNVGSPVSAVGQLIDWLLASG